MSNAKAVIFIVIGVLCTRVALAGGWRQSADRLASEARGRPRPAEVSCGAIYPEVAFSPDGGAGRLIVHTINEARRSIRVQAYSFSSRPILRALLAAHRRGVQIQVIVDKSDLKARDSLGVRKMLSAGIPVWVDMTPRIAHNKVMIIDGQTVITGSYNFSWSASHENAENVLVLPCQALADRYLANWRWRKAYSGRETVR